MMRVRVAAVLSCLALLSVVGADAVAAAPVSSLALSTSTVTGGNSATATVRLSEAAPAGGTVVAVTDDSAAVSVPANVTVAAGATSSNFTVGTVSVSLATTATISATAEGVSRTAVLTVNPPPGPAAPSLLSPAADATVAQPVTFDWNDVTNASSYEIQVDDSSRIASPFIANQTVSASQASIGSLPAQRLWWRVRARNSAGVFGSYSSTRRFTAQAATVAATLASLSLAPTSVPGGEAATGTVTLSAAAPTGGAAVTLASADPTVVSVPASVTVSAGGTSATFTATTATVTTSTSVALTASWSGVIRSATVTVGPPGPAVPDLSYVALSHTSLDRVGNIATGEVRLVGVTGTPVVVALTSSHPSIARVTLGTTTEVASVQVEPGFDQAVFLLRHVAAVTVPTVVTITASANGITKTTQLTISPTPGLAFFAATMDMGPGYVGSNFVDTATSGTTLGVSGYTAVVNFQIISGQLPDGLSLVNPGAGGATPDFPPMRSVVGVPTKVETRTFTLRATDTGNGNTATITVTITINAALGITITPQLPWTPVVGSFTNLWVTGDGGVRPYTWVRTAGQFPPGMSLVQDNATGPLVRVTGTPTTAGTYNFTLRITDAQGGVGIQALTVTVSPA